MEYQKKKKKKLLKKKKKKKWRSLVFHCNVICLTLSRLFFFFAGNFFFDFAILVSSLTVILLHSQGFCLSYRVTQSVSHYAMSNTLISKKQKTSAPLSCLFLIFWMQLQRFLLEIKNQLVKTVCFVSIWGLYSKTVV